MRISKMIFKTHKNSTDLDKATDRLIRGNFIQKESAGIFRFNVMGIKMINKIKNIIIKELNNIHCYEVALPILQDSEIWSKSGRNEAYGPERFTLQDRKNHTLYLAPTAEESATELVNNYVTSHKQLPINIFQILEKYRDEIRPRFGLVRSRQFIMKDAYSFDASASDAKNTYAKYYNCYLKIFKSMGINIYPVESNVGDIGGKLTHEFVAINTTLGEDKLYYNELINHGIENLDDIKLQCSFNSTDNKYTKETKCLELGQLYLLDSQYSEKMKVFFDSKEGTKSPFFMGCYGIGVTRVMAYLAETKAVFPENVAPFTIHLISQQEKGEEFYNLVKHKHDILFDDRNCGFGQKKQDGEILGIPYEIIIGNNIEFNDKIKQTTSLFNNIHDLISFLDNKF